jgi:hypothetical protein
MGIVAGSAEPRRGLPGMHTFRPETCTAAAGFDRDWAEGAERVWVAAYAEALVALMKQAPSEGLGYGCRAVRNAELVVEVREVGLYGRGAEI